MIRKHKICPRIASEILSETEQVLIRGTGRFSDLFCSGKMRSGKIVI
jgi:hypothetical protein